MKKINYVLLQLMLSILLITLGLLIHFFGENTVKGVSLILLTVPGIVLFLSFFIELLKLKKDIYYIPIYFILIVGLDFLVYFVFDVSLTSSLAWVLFVLVALISTLICFLFHVVYQTLIISSKK
ncbi:MAG: hypothetical protein ACOX1F_00350 [Erysipelotrichaceae bacterium]|jgi:hypothetical protein